ncbi:MAG: hypothetical protein PWP64_1100 [Candidatus Cloacimonadota bacterium]|nr:hypothetical protein [Candidatus Cloacimonadota bacterium]
MHKLVLFLILLVSTSSLISVANPSLDFARVNGTNVSSGSTINIEMDSYNNEFPFLVRWSNSGDDSPAGMNSISVSFPNFTSSSHMTRVRNGSGTDDDLSYHEYWGSVGGGDQFADYVMTEVVDTDIWDGSDYLNDEENEFEVLIKPGSWGTFPIYFRAAASHTNSLSDFNYTPDSGPYDCIGFHSYYVYVNIIPPGQPDLEIQNYYVNNYSSSVIVVQGDQLSINCRVKNTGNAIANGDRVGYYWEDDYPSNLNDLENLIGYDSYGDLDPGEYSDESFSFNVPSTTNPGTYYLVFYADYRDEEPNESEEDNNLEYVTVTVQATLPDLTINNLNVSPSSVQPGEIIEIDYRYRNIGNASAGSARTYFYLSTDQDFGDADDFQLGYYTEDSITADAYIDRECNFYIPQGTSNGTRYLYVKVDGSGIIEESNEDNNVAGPSDSFSIVNPWVIEVSPSTYDFGDVHVGDNSSTHQFTFTNTGGSSCTVSFELYDGDDFEITSGEGSYTLNPGSSRSVYVRFEPQSTGYKTDYLEARVGSTFLATAILQGTGLAALPDLTVDNISIVQSSVIVGEDFDLSYRLRNLGLGGSGFCLTKFFISDNITFGDDDDILVDQTVENPVPATTNVDLVKNILVPQGTHSGPWYVYVFVDATEGMDESNENNNLGVSPSTISVIGIPDPPIALEADNITMDGFRARWNSVPNATSYSLDVSMSINFDSFVNGYNGYSVSGTNHTLSGLIAGTDYFYRVRAVNSAGPSINSNIVSLSTEYSTIPMIQLSVPYYRQIRELWCGIASLSMLSKFTGVMEKSKQWNLAAILDQSANEGTEVDNLNNYNLVSELEQSDLDNFNWVTGHVWTRNAIKNKTIEIISSGKPIMWGGSGHGRVITGISPYGVWVNDPASSHYANQFYEWDNFLNYYEAVTPISVLATYFYVEASQTTTVNNVCFNMEYSLDDVNSTFDTYCALNKYGNAIHKLGFDVDGTENEYGYFYKQIDSQAPSWHPIDDIFQRKVTLADVIYIEPEVLSYSAPQYAPFFLRAKVYLNEILIEEYHGSEFMLTQERDYLKASEYTNTVSSEGGISFEASSLIGEGIYDLVLELVDSNTSSVLDKMKFKLPIATSQYASYDFMTSSAALEVSYGYNTMFTFSITNLGSDSDSFSILSYPSNSYLHTTVSIDPNMNHESHFYLNTAELPAGSEGEMHFVIQSQNDPNRKKLYAIPYIVSQSSPIAILATDITQTSFQANWEASLGATSYLLDVSRNESFSSYVIGYHNKPVSGTNELVTGLHSGLTYYYRVRALNGSISSPYSNSISVVTSYIKVTAPNTADISWQVNTSQQITWSAASLGGSVTISLVKGPYNTHILTISSSTSLNQGHYNWSIPETISQASDYRVKITSNENQNVYDFGDNYFTINQPPSLTVSSPDGGEVWYKGQSYAIRWTQNLIPGNVRVQLHRGTSSTILSTPSGSISASEEVLYWDVPTTLTNATNYRIRVISIDTPSLYADSPYFSIQSNPGVLAAPVNAQIIRIGNMVYISWNSVSGATSYRIESSTNATGVFIQVGNTSNTTWSITDSSDKRFYRIIATN